MKTDTLILAAGALYLLTRRTNGTGASASYGGQYAGYTDGSEPAGELFDTPTTTGPTPGGGGFLASIDRALGAADGGTTRYNITPTTPQPTNPYPLTFANPLTLTPTAPLNRAPTSAAPTFRVYDLARDNLGTLPGTPEPTRAPAPQFTPAPPPRPAASAPLLNPEVARLNALGLNTPAPRNYGPPTSAAAPPTPAPKSLRDPTNAANFATRIIPISGAIKWATPIARSLPAATAKLGPRIGGALIDLLPTGVR